MKFTEEKSRKMNNSALINRTQSGVQRLAISSAGWRIELFIRQLADTRRIQCYALIK